MSTSHVEMKLRNAEGKEVGNRKVPATMLNVTKTVGGLLHQVVRWQRAKKRAGTHTVLTRAEMSGGGAKPWKQKGTGRARAGSNTSPLWVGGGIAHGPKQRSYEFSLNKKQKKAALAGALGEKNQEGQLLLVDSFGLSGIRTKAAQGVLTKLGLTENDKVLVVLSATDTVTEKSLRNLPKVKVLKAAGLNVYDVLLARYVVITAEAMGEVESRFGTVE